MLDYLKKFFLKFMMKKPTIYMYKSKSDKIQSSSRLLVFSSHESSRFSILWDLHLEFKFAG